MPFFWLLIDGSGGVGGRSAEMASREAAEEWLSANWRDLRASGTVEVALVGNDDEIYRMSLEEG